MVHIHGRPKCGYWILLILLFFFASTANAGRLYQWGESKNISLDVPNKQLCTYDGLCYKYNDLGYFEIFKEGIWQGNLAFGVKGTYLSTTTTKTTTDFNWTWSVIQDTPTRIEVEADNGDNQTNWKLNLVATEFAPLKITHKATNNLPNPITNTELFYAVEVNQEENPYIYWEKKDGTISIYDYGIAKHFTSQDTNLNEYVEKAEMWKFGFFFEDLVKNGFTIKRAYFGDLNKLNEKFLDSNGFVIGVTKGSGTISSGQTIITDPVIKIGGVNDANDGKILFINNVWASDSNAAINVGHQTGPVDLVFNRAILLFGIGGLTNVVDANFNIFFSSKTITAETCTFDLNSIIDVGPEGISGKPSNGGDWNSQTFETIKSDWFSDTLDSNLSVDINTAINNSIAASRNYIAFRIGMADESSYTDPTTSCLINFCDTKAITTGCSLLGTADPFIQYRQPTTFGGGQFFQTTETDDGNLVLSNQTSLKYFLSGDYNSIITDAGSSATWDDFNWNEGQPYKQEYPNNSVVVPDINMQLNQLLYHGDDDVDYSGNSQGNTLSNSPDFNANGIIGVGMDFNGDERIVFATLPAVLEGKSALSVSAWVKNRNSTPLEDEYIAVASGVGNDLFYLSWQTTQNVQYRIYGDGNNQAYSATYVDGITNTEWHHVTGVFDGQTVKVYVDGKPSPEIIFQGLTQSDQSNFVRVGGSVNANDWNGSIDELAIWTRALTPAEVINLYRRGAVDLNIQVRSCDDSACSGETFVGGDGTAASNFIDGNKSYDLNVVAQNRYFQYKVVYTTIDGNSQMEITPKMSGITINYTLAGGTPCTDNGANSDWVINQACHFRNTTINIGSGTLYITKNGLIGLDNSILLARKVSYEVGTSPGPRIQYTNGGKIVLK